MKNSLKLIIIGGVAGGASAAARARRLSEKAQIILFEKGKYISFANCGLPYHIGGEIKDRESLLVQTPQKMYNRFNIDVRIRQEVIKIDRTKKTVAVLNHATGKKYIESYDKLILSPGAAPIRPPFPGIDNPKILTLRNIPDMDKIKTIVDEHHVKNAVVVGGGYIGLEMTEALTHRNIGVTIVELANQVMGPADFEMANLLHQELRLNGVDLKLGVGVSEFKQSDKLQVVLSNNEKIDTDLVILAIGVKPDIKLAKDSNLTIGKLGGISVNQHMQTTDKNIYAVGDAIEVNDFISGDKTLIPLAGPANRQGRIAADNIFGYTSEYKGTQGTGICKVFNQTIAMTGQNEKLLQAKKIAYQKIYLHAASHAGYYPGATPISLKLLFAPDGKILGAQAVGLNGVDKRIDVLATYIRAGLRVYDLQDAELCYAPPYGSAKDPINYAGFVASNVLKNDMPIIYAEDINNTKNAILVDVRTAAEFESGTIAGAMNIPVDNLREQIHKLPKDKKIIVFCRVGLRAHVATRILMQLGFDVVNLTGGYMTYKMVNNELQDSPLTHEIHSDSGKEDNLENSIKKEIDARGLQCPGPIQKLKEELDALKEGDAIAILTSDSGFINDAPAWCAATNNKFIKNTLCDGCYKTIICKGLAYKTSNKKLTIVVFSGDFDKAMAAFIIANGAVAMGYDVTLFFTFWGLNILRQDSTIKIRKTFIEKMFSKMMPRGAKKLALSKMNMLGIGTAMIQNIMKNKNVSSLSELIEQAMKSNVKLVACSMSMDLMGIKEAELIEGVNQGGVAMYLNEAGQGQVNLFI